MSIVDLSLHKTMNAPSICATMDFETYSEAGFVWLEDEEKWVGPPGSEKKKGIDAVGAAAYAEHPSTEILTLSYSFPGETAKRRWRPGQPLPFDLFTWLWNGGLVEAHNVMFERLIWFYVAQRKYAFPLLNPYQLRCSMATARVNALPGALGGLSDVLALPTPKDADGKRLLKKFSVPQTPTKKRPHTRWFPHDDPEDFEKLCLYCDTDIDAERGVSHHPRVKPMSPDELEFWLIDQEINWRGLKIDVQAVTNMQFILDAAIERYGEEFRGITGLNPTQLEKFKGWLAAYGVVVGQLREDDLEELLSRRDIQGIPRRALEIRGLIGSASVKKIYAMARYANSDGRVRNLIIHHGARTGRPTGDGPQPLNMPKSGPDLAWCGKCKMPSSFGRPACPWCGQSLAGIKKSEWEFEHEFEDGSIGEAVEAALSVMATRDLATVEHFFGDALLTISGCVRSMFIAEDGHDLIASDFSAIEAVVIAMLAGEDWRIQAFRDKIDIYLASAARITGWTVEQYVSYAKEHGQKHPHRQKIGKPAELGLGFGGWLGAWRQFDDTDTFTDDEVKKNIIAWRDASPNIVEFWGGQFRGRPWGPDYRPELFGVEGVFISAIQNPGHRYDFKGMKFFMENDKMIIRLLSGRELTYHEPRLYPGDDRRGGLQILYKTWNTNPKYGPMGWVDMKTYGGRLTENIVQATAHDILRYAVVNLRAAGYPTVLHVYDEIVVEVPKGFGSIEEVERIMATMPHWAHDWPVRASGGWRGLRYRKA